jgi:hypothetical protein
MKRSIKIASIVLAVIVTLAVGTVLYNSEALVSPEQLRTEGFKLWSIAGVTQLGSYVATFYKNKTEVAEVSVDVDPVMPQLGLASMKFDISHEVGVIDSLYLEFTPMNGLIQLYLERPGAQIWPPMIFQTSSDGRSTIVGVDHLGLIGIGTIELNFYLEPQQTTGFWFYVNFTMRPTGFLTTRQAGSAQVELPITYANAT